MLQPLDVSVYSILKYILQRESRAAARVKRVLNCFDEEDTIRNSHFESFTVRIMQSGFSRTRIWEPRKQMASIYPLLSISYFNPDSTKLTSVDDGIQSFNDKGKSLLRNTEVDLSGSVTVNTVAGAHLTAVCVIRALEKRERRRTTAERITIQSAEVRNNRH